MARPPPPPPPPPPPLPPHVPCPARSACAHASCATGRLDVLRERLQQATGEGEADRLHALTEVEAEREKLLKELDAAEAKQEWERLQPLQSALEFADSAASRAQALLAPTPAAEARDSASLEEVGGEAAETADIDEESDDDDEDMLLQMMAARRKASGKHRKRGS